MRSRFEVDFKKTRDFVEWCYLDDVMRKMKFPTVWRKWIREYISTPTAFVLVNVNPTEEFYLETGLRQGDLVSPFLFLLVVEGLQVMMSSIVGNNLFYGYQVGTYGSLAISHLQYADDTL